MIDHAKQYHYPIGGRLLADKLNPQRALEAYINYPTFQFFVSKTLNPFANERFILDFECQD